jgi:endoglycosylceramidase
LLPAPAGASLAPLHATRGEAPGIFDSRGREVLLRGVNVNALGDYFQANADYPTVVPLRRSDFGRISRLGFNSVRLLVSWSRLQPERGAYNRAYVKRIKRAVGWAREQGIYVVIDMHQDAWGKHIATPPGASCPSGTNPSIGWDGAPKWATITDGASTCNFGLRELAPAVTQAWQSFYEDREGIQTQLVRTWGRLARGFARSRTVAGFDLLNEPAAGFEPGVNDTVGLGEFYGRAIEAIRAGEDSKRDPVEHIVFFEPGVIWSAVGNYSIPPPAFTDDDNIVFAPHIYAESIAPASIDQGFEFARQAAAAYGTTVWSGEWGYFGDPAADADKVRRYGEAEDANLYGGAWWDYKQSCGDPHVIHERDGTPDPISPSLVRFACEGSGVGKELGVPKPFATVLARPVPRAVPGEISSLRSDGAAGTMELEARTPHSSCGLTVHVPRTRGIRVRGDDGVKKVTIAPAAGGASIVKACVRGSYSLSVR